MPVFASSTTAQKQASGGFMLKSILLILSASSTDEAEGKALENARKQMPQAQGFSNYNVTIGETSKESLERLVVHARREEEIKAKKI